MTKAHPSFSNETTPEVSSPSARRCLVSLEVKPKSELVRFALDPSKIIVPDIAGKLPGRGLWVTADAAHIDEAIQKNLFSKAAKTKVTVPADLKDQVAHLLQRRCLDLLGLAKASGAVLAREQKVLEALSAHELTGILLAQDAGKDIKKKTQRAELFSDQMTRDELGAALGREHAAVVGLLPHPLAKKLKQELARWQGVKAQESLFINCQSNQPCVTEVVT